MKKLLCVLLTLSLILCAAALAEGTYNQNTSTASTTLTTTINGPDAPSYTLIIPSTLTITPNATSTTLTVQLTEANNANSIRVETAANGSMTISAKRFAFTTPMVRSVFRYPCRSISSQTSANCSLRFCSAGVSFLSFFAIVPCSDPKIFIIVPRQTGDCKKV